MRLRRALLVSLAVGFTVASSATGAVKPFCNVVSDETGDGEMALLPVESDALDIVSGDIATGAREIGGILRLKGLNFAADPTSKVFSYNYDLATTLQGVQYRFWARRPSSGVWESGFVVGSESVPLSFWKVEGATLQWKAQRAKVKALGKPKLVFSQFRASTESFGQSADAALNETLKYPDRAPSCFKVA